MLLVYTNHALSYADVVCSYLHQDLFAADQESRDWLRGVTWPARLRAQHKRPVSPVTSETSQVSRAPTSALAAHRTISPLSAVSTIHYPPLLSSGDTRARGDTWPAHNYIGAKVSSNIGTSINSGDHYLLFTHSRQLLLILPKLILVKIHPAWIIEDKKTCVVQLQE